jgi:hypothetical protein
VILKHSLLLLAFIGATLSHAAVPAARKSLAHPKAELATAAQAAVAHGVHAELPPHISTLLGLAHEEKCDVLQGVLRSASSVQGIDVLDKNHGDIVIFTVNLATKDQTFYLTSPTGTLRKLLTVSQGVGQVVEPTKADIEAFQSEKKMWVERLAAPAPPAQSPRR